MQKWSISRSDPNDCTICAYSPPKPWSSQCDAHGSSCYRVISIAGIADAHGSDPNVCAVHAYSPPSLDLLNPMPMSVLATALSLPLAHPRANSPPALRLRALASPVRISPIDRGVCASAVIARNQCVVVVSGGVKAEIMKAGAPGLDVLKRATMLFALGCCAYSTAVVLGCGAAWAVAEDSI
jgi:hypothetical protein